MKKAKINKSLPYDRISTYFKTNGPLVAMFCIAGLLFDGLMSFIPNYLGKIINMAILGETAKTILTNGLWFIALVVFIQVNRFLKRYLVRLFANRMTFTMRKISFNYIIHSPMGEATKFSKGDILNRNLTDISDSAEGIRKITTEVFDTFVLLLGYLISLFVFDWEITLITVAFISFSVFIAQVLKKLVYSSVREYKRYLSTTKDQTLYSLQNETYYRGLGVTSYYQDKYEGSQTHLEKLAVKSMMLQSSLEPVYQIIVWFDLIFVLWLGGGRVIDKTWLLGDFSAYLTTFMLIATKASRIGKLFNSYQGLKVSWERCRIYMKFPEQTEEKSQLDASGLEIKNLSFGFKPEETLKNISFSARPGEIVGICGRVHSGKSTLLQAINGLYEYSGSATLGGVETKKIRQEELDGLIGFCSSSSQIYQDTIQNNISLGRSESIDEALHLSHLEDEVKDMDINLTRSVANLSGGQQKRLMIARAVYRSPRLIMLDNPFESIDEPMSLEILTLTRSSLKNSVVLLVSNQENILRCCDKLLYLKDYSGTFSTYEDLRGDEDFETFLGGVPK